MQAYAFGSKCRHIWNEIQLSYLKVFLLELKIAGAQHNVVHSLVYGIKEYTIRTFYCSSALHRNGGTYHQLFKLTDVVNRYMTVDCVHFNNYLMRSCLVSELSIGRNGLFGNNYYSFTIIITSNVNSPTIWHFSNGNDFIDWQQFTYK